jgi:hypothetical protein
MGRAKARAAATGVRSRRGEGREVRETIARGGEDPIILLVQFD